MYRPAWQSIALLSLAAALAACSATDAVTPDLSGAVAAKAVKPVLKDLPVASTVADGDVSGTFQLRSDGLGVYLNSGSLTSLVDGGNGDWTLGSYFAGGTRQLTLDFSRPVAGSTLAGDVIPSGTYVFNMIARCHLVNVDMQQMTLGQAVNCPLRIGQLRVNNISTGQAYGITMNPGTTTGTESYPGTNYALVTCNSLNATATLCNSWTITPTGTEGGRPSNRVVLTKTVSTTVRGKSTTSEVAQREYWMSFRFTL